MDIVFFASGKFAVKILEELIGAGHKVSLVVTRPDMPKGRHLDFMPTEVKKRARELNLKVYQPQNPNSEEAICLIKSVPADLFVVVSYGHILKDALLQLPKLYPLNIHASLLPKYRGAAPINWAIVNGEKETGVSIIRMVERMDAGDILLQKKISISREDDAETVEEKLWALSAASLIEVINLIQAGRVEFTKQEEKDVSFAPKLEKGHGLIDWNKSSVEIANQINGLIPWPAAYTFYKGKLLKIWKTKVKNEGGAGPGEIIEAGNGGLIIGTAKGALEVIELQLENGKRLGAEAFLCGHNMQAGEKLG